MDPKSIESTAGFQPAGSDVNTQPMMDKIKHVVVIMLENRGFDTVLGYLYQPDDKPKQNIPPLKPDELIFNGLSFVDTQALSNTLVKNGQTIKQSPVPIVRATNSPGWDSGEEYAHVNMQLFGSTTPSAGQPEMKGFLQDYSTQCKGDVEAIKQIMHMYTPTDLPVLNGLAKAYAVSDMGFSSVPTQTNANRAFSICGTSLGLVDNGFLAPDPIKRSLPMTASIPIPSGMFLRIIISMIGRYSGMFHSLSGAQCPIRGTFFPISRKSRT